MTHLSPDCSRPGCPMAKASRKGIRCPTNIFLLSAGHHLLHTPIAFAANTGKNRSLRAGLMVAAREIADIGQTGLPKGYARTRHPPPGGGPPAKADHLRGCGIGRL